MPLSSWRRRLAAALIALTPLSAFSNTGEVSLDYAYYSPPSLVIRDQGWLEEHFSEQGRNVKWVLSRGSNNSLEFLNSGATQFALTSSISAFISRANGQPVKTVYSYLWAEPSALVVPEQSEISDFEDIRGKRVAATKGTDPYFFLLRALERHNLTSRDVRIVHLQHPEGRTALEQGRVDVWAGLDPHMAASEAAGARFLYRNPDFGLAAFLNTSERVLESQPETVEAVVNAYERARQWIIDHPDQTAELVARETGLPEEVIRLQLARYDFSRPVPGQAHLDAIRPIVPLLQADNILRSTADTEGTLASLLAADIAQRVVEGQAP